MNDAYSRLYGAAEDAMADGLTEEQALQAVRNAASSLEADRMTAWDQGRPDPYPHLGNLSHPYG